MRRTGADQDTAGLNSRLPGAMLLRLQAAPRSQAGLSDVLPVRARSTACTRELVQLSENHSRQFWHRLPPPGWLDLEFFSPCAAVWG